MAVAAGAPAGTPLDDAAVRMLRARLEEMGAAIARLPGAATGP